MVQVIYGPKGTGKTKQIIEQANADALSAKGDIVFIDKDNRKIHNVNRQIRLVDTAEYGISGDIALAAFIKGLLAGNRDIEAVYLDGISAITNTAVADGETLYGELETIADKHQIRIILTVSCAEEELPPFLHKYKPKAKAVKKAK